MNMRTSNKILSLLLSLVMLVGMMPLSVYAYWEEPTAEGNAALETTVNDYTKPVGMTMQRLTGNCQTEVDNLGDDFLFVIKSGDRYYAMKDVAAREEEYTSIPAVDITSWVNQDGTLTVPADTLDVAFWRYEERPTNELGEFINGREDYLAYTYDYESMDGDDDYYNDAERTYTGSFKVTTFKEGEYISFKPYYWSENGVSGTLKFGGTWSYKISSYNYLNLKYNLIADLRDDGNGGKEFYFRYLGTDVEYTGEEVEGYFYYVDCRHQFTVRHAEYDAPTCMLKGCEEYWYCEGCNIYFKDAEFQSRFGHEMPVIPATGHDWDNEKCKNCNRPVPVYSKVTNQAQFDALADDTMFILVTEYNGKYYVPNLTEIYRYMIDSDGDGYSDIHDIDEDKDGIPDYLEFDEGPDEPNGVLDYLEWDMDNDGDVDEHDQLEFHKMICEQHLTDMLYQNGSVNATEVTMNSDGTFSHEEVKSTLEFEMVDVYLQKEYDPDFHNHWVNGEMPYHTKCIKQFVIPNMFISAPSMAPVERMYQQRIYDFGDSSSWGVVFYDNRNEYYYYPEGDMAGEKASPLPFLDINKDNSVAIFDTFDDIMWVCYDEGQLGQLRLRDYNGKISFVTGHSWELDGWEWVDDENNENGGYYDTHDTQACVYLYASAQNNSHTCVFTDWYPNGDKNHMRDCMDDTCEKYETLPHDWDEGEITKEPTESEEGIKTYTCRVCSHTKTEPVEKLVHECVFTDWYPNGDENHMRDCMDDTCEKYETLPHDWDEGEITKEPTESEEGIKTYTCMVCSHTKTEPVDNQAHECVWSDWYSNGDENHKRDCMDDTCEKYETLPHNWDDGKITKEPTSEEKGIRTYTCIDGCGGFYIEEIPQLKDGLCEGNDGKWYYYTNNEVNTGYTGMAQNETGLWYVKNGVMDTTFTGMTVYKGKCIYVNKGKYDTTFTGIAKNSAGIWYINKGNLDLTYTGMAKNAYGLWYMKDGKLDTTFTGMTVYNGKCIYVNKGKYDTTYTGIVKNSAGLWYFSKGNLDLNYTGMAEYNGKWIYVNKGKYDTTFTGIAKNASGCWYINKGNLDTTYTGMAQNDYGIWYMKNGKLDTTFSGMIVYKGKCIYVNKGKYDTTYTGMAQNSAGWWYINKGNLDLTYTGMAEHSSGVWYMKNGKLDTTFTGMIVYKGKCIYVNKGKYDTTYTGLAKNSAGFWYINKGNFDNTYTGFVKNSAGYWYIQKGKLDMTFSGKVVVNGKTFTVKNGKLV